MNTKKKIQKSYSFNWVYFTVLYDFLIDKQINAFIYSFILFSFLIYLFSLFLPRVIIQTVIWYIAYCILYCRILQNWNSVPIFNLPWNNLCCDYNNSSYDFNRSGHLQKFMISVEGIKYQFMCYFLWNNL